ncbi:hypothetical protein [Natranaerobius trueperi]|uniref:hypothetical protein n=1 Tax=Natranaerobius trueperi TaxID=759412 RepID=UPI00197BCCA3|nr:hypothetical protein [Natranaerobius trueperi]
MKTGYPCEGMVEPESTKGARRTNSLEPSKKDGAESLLDKLLHTGNLNAAYKRVKQNRGAAGVDGMTVDELMPYLKENKCEVLHSNPLNRQVPNGTVGGVRGR